MNRKYALIINALSDSGRGIRYFQKHRLLIDQKLHSPLVYRVKKEESISEIAASLADQYDVVIACGGDGTVSKTAAGLIGKDSLMGVLSLGSGNDFAKMIGVNTLALQDQLEIILSEKIRKVDIIQVNDDYFINTFGIGFNGLTNLLATRSMIKGPLKYVWSGVKALFLGKSFNAELELEGKKFSQRTKVIALANGKWEGGKYLISPDSVHNDQYFELILLKDISIIRLASEFLKLSAGGRLSDSVIQIFTLQKADIQLDRSVYSHSDGEVVGMTNHFTVQLLSDKIKVISATL